MSNKGTDIAIIHNEDTQRKRRIVVSTQQQAKKMKESGESTLESMDVATPLGTIVLTASNSEIISLKFAHPTQAKQNAKEPSKVLLQAKKQLDEYFAGERKEFELPLSLKGTPFQLKVWKLLQRIPFGQVRTYGELAKELNSAPRAVGGACGKNPVAVVVPCHRVLAADSSLCGFSSVGGIQTKKQLLTLEKYDKFSE